MKKAIMAMALVATTILASLPLNVSAQDSEAMVNKASEDKKQQVEQLIEQRSKLMLEVDFDENNLEIKKIDAKLTSLGAEFLTDEQVAEQFPESKLNKVASQDQMKTIQPYANPPQSNVNTWISFRTPNCLYEGKRYNVQTLAASPKSPYSPLNNDGIRVVQYNRNWKAGAQNLVKSVASSAAGTIPGAGIAISIYDALKSFVSGISTTTEVTLASVSYAWSTSTTVTFEFVRLENQSDDYQTLTFIHSKVMGYIGYQIPRGSSYKTAGGQTVYFPSLDQQKQFVFVYPHPVVEESPSLYGYVHGKMVDARVSSVQLSGPESKSVQKIYPCYPNFPMQCE
jgi:hypothetical protein